MSDNPAKRPRIDLTLDLKLKLIADSEKIPKPTQKELATMYGIGRTTVGDILKRKNEIKQKLAENVGSDKKRFYSKCKFETINTMTFQWFVKTRAKNIPLSGPIIKAKALSFAKELDLLDFKASDGWLTSWKNRNNIKAFKVSGKSAGVDITTLDDFKCRIPTLVEGYANDDIFNCDFERDIIDAHKSSVDGSVEIEERDSDDDDVTTDLKHSDALKMLDKLKKFAVLKEPRILDALLKLEESLEGYAIEVKYNRNQQTTLDSFVP